MIVLYVFYNIFSILLNLKHYYCCCCCYWSGSEILLLSEKIRIVACTMLFHGSIGKGPVSDVLF